MEMIFSISKDRSFRRYRKLFKAGLLVDLAVCALCITAIPESIDLQNSADNPHHNLNIIKILAINADETNADETNNFISGASNNLELQLFIILISIGNTVRIEACNTINLLKNAGY